MCEQVALALPETGAEQHRGATATRTVERPGAVPEQLGEPVLDIALA
jgi:hypothetical protein